MQAMITEPVNNTKLHSPFHAISPPIKPKLFGDEDRDSCSERKAINVGWKSKNGSSSSFVSIIGAFKQLYRIDDFDLEKIGSGFFSDVYKAIHKQTHDVFALKINRSNVEKANVLFEVQLMNTLNHPNILRFLGVCIDNGHVHALTELSDGNSLQSWVLEKKNIELPWTVRVRIALETAQAMSYLHEKGWFHRDLTSKNVLLRTDGKDMEFPYSAVVADFGLAAKIPEKDSQLSRVGTPYYMAPEILTGKAYNQLADVFSFGILLCEMIARIDPDPEILPRTQNFGLDYRAFGELCSKSTPPYFLQVAYKCCVVDPKLRPNFKEIVVELEQLLKKLNAQKCVERIRRTPSPGKRRSSYARCPTSLTTEDIGIKSKKMAYLHNYPGSAEERRNRFTFKSRTIDTEETDNQKNIYSSCLNNAGRRSPQIDFGVHCVGERMSQFDPHYLPRQANPFLNGYAEFQNRRKLLGSLNRSLAEYSNRAARSDYSTDYSSYNSNGACTPNEANSNENDFDVNLYQYLSAFQQSNTVQLLRKFHSCPDLWLLSRPTLNHKRSKRLSMVPSNSLPLSKISNLIACSNSSSSSDSIVEIGCENVQPFSCSTSDSGACTTPPPPYVNLLRR